MSKLPYGGFDPREESIEDDADPGPLLDEIAQCALDGRPLRPQLARWFVHKVERGLVEVKRRRGRKRSDSFDKEFEALQAIEELTEGGHPIEEAIATVRVQLKLKASRETIHRWRQERLEAAAEMAEEVRVDLMEVVREQLRAIGIEGVTGAAAVAYLMRKRPAKSS